MFNDMMAKPYIVYWCSFLRDLVCLIGLPGAFFFQTVDDDKLFLKPKINDIFYSTDIRV